LSSSEHRRGDESADNSPAHTDATEYAGGASYPSDGWLRTVLENTSDVICVLGADGTFLYVSPAIEKVLGYLPEDLTGTVSFDYVYSDDAAFVAESFAQILHARGVHAPIEFRTRAADGSVRHVQAVPNNQLDDPVLRGVVVTFRDLTKRVRMEEEVRFQARLLDAVGQSVIATDRHGKIAYWNLASEEVYGWSAEEATGRTVLDIVLPEQTPGQREAIMLGLREGRSWSGEFELRRKDGTVFPAMITTSPVLDDGDNVVGIIGVSTDITERKRAEEALQHSEEFVSQLLHNFPNGSVSVFDRDLYYVFAEGKVLEQIGLPSETVIGRNLRELLPEEVIDSAERYYRRVLSGETVEFELPQGGGVYAINAAPLRSENGNIYAIIAIAQNITDRKKAEEKLRASEERFRYLVQNSSDIITMVNVDGRVLYVSPAIERILGHHPTEMVGQSAFELVHPDDTGQTRDAFTRALQSPSMSVSLEIRMQHKDGSWRYVEVTGTNLLAEPSTNAIVLNSRDVSERRLMEAERREAEERYRILVERIPAIVYIDEAGKPARTTYVSPQNETILGYPPEEAIKDPDHWIKIMHPDDRERVLAESRRTDETGEPFRVEYRQVAKDGSVVWLRDEADLVRDKNQKPLYWLGVLTDITERKALEEKLRRRASHDRLTGLPNRELFMDRLRQALERTRRRRMRKVAVLFMDLDGFKVINDSLGHELGDLLLVIVAQRLRRCLRPEDTLARFGGDEFVVLLEEVEDPDEAAQVAERITHELRRPFVLEGRELFASISIGIALGNAAEKTPEDLLRDADTAMYWVKEGGSGYRVFNPTMYERAVKRLDLANDLRRAVEVEELVLHYQPMISVRTGGIVGLEALARWNHPERGLLAPTEFISISEETGMIVPLGRWVLNEACRQAKEWQRLYPTDPPLSMSVNLSARQLHGPDIVAEVADALEGAGLDPNSLMLEITESVLVEERADIDDKLRALKDLGVGLTIDDFGTGYSSFSYLKYLPIDRLKIDRTFVGGIGTDHVNSSIMKAAVMLGHAIGIDVAAEGIETVEEFEALRTHECDIGQGYYWWGPSPVEEAAVLLESSFSPGA
jgi:diguanylate cyclase (GGDEF)-like protein/PAS domain S-box-containing protein